MSQVYESKSDRISVYELSWRASYQIVLADDNANVIGWGSGFVLMVNGEQFFITVDHCLHLRDFEEGIRTGEQQRIFVYNNITINESCQNIQTELNKEGWNYLAVSQLDSEIPEILDIVDVAYYKISRFPYQVLTTPLYKEYKGRLYQLCDGNRVKIAILSEHTTEFSMDDCYIVSGMCNNEMRTEMLNCRESIVIEDMRFTRFDSDGNAILVANEKLDPIYCSGLSGSPVFNSNGYFVGMLQRIAENNTLTVIPFNQIIKVIQQIEVLA